MVTINRDKKLIVKPDNKRRVLLPKELVSAGIMFHIYTNSSGKIILDPQVSIPASEAWLFNNPDALALAKRGLDDAREGRVSRVDLESL